MRKQLFLENAQESVKHISYNFTSISNKIKMGLFVLLHQHMQSPPSPWIPFFSGSNFIICRRPKTALQVYCKKLVQKNKHSVLRKYTTKYRYPGRWRTLYLYDICFLDLSTLYARSRDGTKSFRMPKARPSSQARDGSCCVPDPGRFPLRLRDGSYPFLPSSFLIRLLDGIQGGPTELNPGIKVF